MLPLETPRLRVELHRSVFSAFLGPGASNIMAGPGEPSGGKEAGREGEREGGKGHLFYLMSWGIPLGTPGLGCTFPCGQGLQLGGA